MFSLFSILLTFILGREDSNHKNFINKLIYIIIYKFIKVGSPKLQNFEPDYKGTR